MTRYDYIKEQLSQLSDADLIAVHNEYCYANSYEDDEIFDMCMFDEICNGMTPTDIAQRIYYGDFNITDNYFVYNGYENFESFDYTDDNKCPICISDIAQYMDDNDEDLSTGILDGYEEDDEDA